MDLNHSHPEIKQIANLEKSYLLRLIISGIGILFLSWISLLIQFGKPLDFSQELYYWAGLTLTTPILYFAGLPFIRSLFNVRSSHYSVDISIITVLIATYFYSMFSTLYYTDDSYAYFDSILIILFIVLSSRYIQIFCQRHISKLVQMLGRLPPKQVKIIRADNQFHACSLEDIVVGDKLYIAPGEYFPVDGIICDSDTSVDESMLTGEAHAIPKFANEKVRAGTCNLDKSVTIKATSNFSNSYFGKILSLMQLNQSQKHRILPCDHIGLWHQLITLTIAAVVYCWWLPYDNQFAIYCAICTLLITSPCAIAIAYPLTTANLLEVCAKKGILIIHAMAFYKLNEVEHILFDKTGTLTEGNLVVDQVEYCNNATAQNVLPLIAVIEKNTHHPIAHAIVQYAELTFTDFPTIEIHRLRVFPGNGIRALVDGKFVLIGSARWLRKNGVFISAEVIEAQENHVHCDHIFVHCAIGGVEVARIQLKDKIRQEASEVIQFLKQRNIEMSVLSGDRPVIVNAIAKQLGQMSATAQALPQDKEEQVIALQDQGFVTAMVGDGLNDAPALKRADIGIAIGANNPISMLCADIVLQTPGLKLIQDCLRISAKSGKILKQNYWIGIIFNCIMLPFAALGYLTPMLMLIGICFNSLLIMANASRLKFKPKQIA
ncbi:MAG: cation-translocating P-type ATPase [Gammaproteobacteria bacterium]|jgi:Cu2+-exporting ATPase|nr:cation-translocating P-type ATPase [Gammaproteobacteria bacterium]